jgi:ABC-2 type transport system permease protein
MLAWALYQFNLFDLGLALIPFIANLLLLGLSLGIIATALIMRYGQAVEMLAWAVPFLMQPFAAVFYPVSVLPRIMQPVAYAIPCTYVFEGMREVLRTGSLSWSHLGWATGLNILYLSLALWFLSWMFNVVRDRGLLGKLGMQ